MCVRHKEQGHYKCCCCFPLVCGVILIALLEVLNLVVAVQFLDIYGIVFSSIVLLMFGASFVKRDSHKVRQSLWMTYAASLILFIIYLVWFTATQNMTTWIDRGCGAVTDVVTWDTCAEDVKSLLWVFVTIYALLVILVRGFFVRVLYWYYKDAVHNEEKYATLNSSHAHDSHH